METNHPALLLQLGTTLPLVGLIWLIQTVAYPLFALVGAAEFPAYHAAHTRWISGLVLPLMVGELAGAAWWLTQTTAPSERPWAVGGAVLLALVWGTTFFVSVPQHARLAGGFDAEAHHTLVGSNWIRTAAWTLRGLLLMWMASRRLH